MSMLSHLRIENIAVIESMDIIFGRGLNLLTGETGAGKSIVIDALGAVLGARTTRELVRTGAPSAHAGAVFTGAGEEVLAWVRDTLGVELGDGELSVSRDIMADGRTVCRAAGRTVTVAQLRELGSKLVQIHGQHDSRMLLDEESHLAILDEYGQTPLAAYIEKYDEWKVLDAERGRLLRDDADKVRRADTLTYQLDEITAADLRPEEDKHLAERRGLLKNAHRVAEAVTEAYQLIYGGDGSAADILGEAARALSGVAGISEELSGLHGRVQDVMYNAQDAAEEIRALKDELEADPDELERIEARLDLLYRLKRKYGAAVEDILAFAESARDELEKIEKSDERLAELNVLCESALDGVKAAAVELSAARAAAAADMRGLLAGELRELDMPSAEFEVALRESGLYRNGAETAEFLFSANAGEPPKPLSKIASGGELSRVQLGLMNIIHGGVPTMVFDEVDAGISGRAAQKVSVKLKNASRDRQVLCVTHLPQIAAAADRHFRIEKAVEGDRTVTKICDLDMDGRVEEIARIIGGTNVTDATRETAKQLIAGADK
ncbi:MAG: DNA repair protein RecN [Oscillospiraceae bacterium]|nr:DNA repair protein RecN [Oscillospiraceae bacterium]